MSSKGFPIAAIDSALYSLPGWDCLSVTEVQSMFWEL